jgi:hypothetical protein
MLIQGLLTFFVLNAKRMVRQLAARPTAAVAA